MIHLDFLFPTLPPALDGIGDYTARLAAALAGHASVRILTAQEGADAVEGVDIIPCFSTRERRGVCEVTSAVRQAPPDWLVVQYNPFAWGMYGLNLHLPYVLWQLKRHHPGLRVAVMFHEDFVPVESWQFAIMTTYQRLQFYLLGRLADVVFFSIEPWAERYAGWFPGRSVVHLPVGSNIPRAADSREACREALNIAPGRPVLGLFGTLHATRLLSHVQAAVDAVVADYPEALLLYVGPHGDALRERLRGIAIQDQGRAPEENVARSLRAMDLHLAPFKDGASTRRGSFIAGLNNGLPSLSTHGELTDHVLQLYDGQGYYLTPVAEPARFAAEARRLMQQPEARQTLAERAEAFHDRMFCWDGIAKRLIATLEKNSSS